MCELSTITSGLDQLHHVVAIGLHRRRSDGVLHGGDCDRLTRFEVQSLKENDCRGFCVINRLFQADAEIEQVFKLSRVNRAGRSIDFFSHAVLHDQFDLSHPPQCILAGSAVHRSHRGIQKGRQQATGCFELGTGFLHYGRHL